MNPAQTILLLDDNPGDATALKNAFADVGMVNPVITFCEARKALAFLRDESQAAPALILCDLNMPEMHGHEFLRLVKEDEALRSIPVVVLTASKTEEDRLASLQFSIAGYMIKPDDFDQLIEVAAAIKNYWTLNEIWSGDVDSGTKSIKGLLDQKPTKPEGIRGNPGSGSDLKEFVVVLTEKLERVGLERRRAKRHTLNASIPLYSRKDTGLMECLGKAWGLDISNGGMGFLTAVRLGEGQSVLVDLEPVVGRSLHLELKVTLCREKEDGLYLVGGAFVFDGNGDAARLNAA